MQAHASEGHAQLAALGLSFAKIATAIGVAPSSVQRWFNAGKAPADPHRLKLAEVFGIEPAAWERSPDERPASVAFAERAEALAVAAAGAAPLPSSVDQLEALIEQCRTARAGGIAPSILARLAALEIRALAERERIKTTLEKAFASPEACAFSEQLFHMINAHPLATIAVTRCMLAAAQPARIGDFDRSYTAWRERHATLVDAAERANAALLAVLPPGASFEASIKNSVAKRSSHHSE